MSFWRNNDVVYKLWGYISNNDVIYKLWGYISFTTRLRPSMSVRPSVPHVVSALWLVAYFMDDIQPRRGRCVPYHFQVNRSKVKVTRFVRIFAVGDLGLRGGGGGGCGVSACCYDVGWKNHWSSAGITRNVSLVYSWIFQKHSTLLIMKFYYLNWRNVVYKEQSYSG